VKYGAAFGCNPTAIFHFVVSGKTLRNVSGSQYTRTPPVISTGISGLGLISVSICPDENDYQKPYVLL
jgi:hypothetical protein